MDERTVLVGDTFFKFRLSSPVGGWFPALQVLSWRITESNLLYIDLFLSPYLKKISIYTPWLWNGPEIPHDTLTVIASTISALPTSVLQSLSVDVSYGIPSAHFTDSLSSVVLRCGLSLTAFTSIVPLSDAAVDHLIRLPHLHTWHIEGPPPSYSTSSLPIVFPPLTEFTIGGGAPGEWISLFRRLEADISTTRGMAPLSRLKNSLKLLNIRLGLSDLVLDVSFTSLIQIFRNLIFLRVRIHCPDQDGEGRCAFRLSDDDVTKLTMALPQLEHLSLGRPCLKNTCATTVACLFQTSVHCVKLRILEIHFNTTTIVGDLKNISRNPRFQGIRSLPKCRVSHMYVDQIPLVLDEPDLETVVNGMVDIFPSLNHCFGLGRVWSRISERITELRESQRIVGESSLGFPPSPVTCLNHV